MAAANTGTNWSDRKYEVSYNISILGVENAKKRLSDMQGVVEKTTAAFSNFSTAIKSVQDAVMATKGIEGVTASITSLSNVFSSASGNAAAFAGSLSRIVTQLKEVAAAATTAAAATSKVMAAAPRTAERAAAPAATTAVASTVRTPAATKIATTVAPVAVTPEARNLTNAMRSGTVTKTVKFVVDEASKTAATESLNAFKTTLANVYSYWAALGKPLKFTANVTEAMAPLQELSGVLARIASWVQYINSGLSAMGAGMAATAAKQPAATGGSGTTVITGTGNGAGGNASGKGNATTGNGNTNTGRGDTTTGKGGGKQKSSIKYPTALGYKVMGPTALDFGFNNIVAFLRSMGIMYGVMGAGSLIGSAVQSATEYNNIMQTTRNILQTHDKGDYFGARFAEMEHTVRNVGTATRFTAPEVADASRFLAMAGFNIKDINEAIRPIADIALVGDTDLGRTADVVTNIMTGYGIQSGDVRHAADIMTMTFTKSNVTLLEIAESFKYAASLLSTAGVSFEEATAAIGVLGNAGIKGSQAGTTMRTILSNIVNPTLKQKKAWDELGIARFDENGQVRKLSDIFGDLNKANLQVADFYRMFHRTAAQGAVALTKNVDTWNDIIRENFLSEGLVGELALAKQNTIQGLWAQITSMFTEQGMRAFEEIEPKIRTILGDALDWLKGNEAGKTIRGVAKDLTSLYGAFKYNISYLYKFYSLMKPVILLWVQWQLLIAPLLTSMRALRSVWLLFMTGIQKSNWAVSLVASFRELNKQLGYNALNVRRVSREYEELQARMRGANAEAKATIMSSGNSLAVTNAYNKIVAPGKAILSGAAGISAAIGGGMAGSRIGSAIGGENSGWSMGMGLLGSAVLPAAFLVSNPAGWITAGVLALGAAVATLVKNTTEAKKAQEELYKTMSRTYLNDKGEAYNGAYKYLDMIETKNKAIKDLLDAQYQKRLELAQLDKEGIVTDQEVVSNFKAAYNGSALNAGNLAWWFGTSETKAESILSKASEAGLFEAGALDKAVFAYPLYQNEAARVAIAGYRYGQGLADEMGKEINAVANAYINSGYANGGKALTDIKQIASKVQAPNIEDYFGTPMSQSAQMGYISDLDSYLSGKRPIQDLLDSSYAAQEAIYMAMDRAWGPESAQMKELQTAISNIDKGAGKYADYLAVMEYGTPNNNDIDILRKAIADTKSFTDYIRATAETDYSFDINKYPEAKGWLDIMNGLNVSRKWTVSDAAANLKQLEAMFDVLMSVPDWNNPNLDDFKKNMDALTNLLGIVAGYDLSELPNWKTGKKKGSQWAGLPYAPGVTVDDVNGEGGGGNENSLGKSKTTWSDPYGEYRSRYTSSAAVPKQVIVKIENLMNVESIDMSNPDNAAVINNFKGQLSQALIDVVHDFDVTYQG